MGLPDRVEAARRGQNPTVVCRTPSGWAVLCDLRRLPGRSLLLPDPAVRDLNALSLKDSGVFLQDMRIIGDALLAVTDAIRVNYAVFGNLDPWLHAHVIPRYTWEPQEMRTRPTSFYDRTQGPKFDEQRDRPLMEKLAKAITRKLQEAGQRKERGHKTPTLLGDVRPERYPCSTTYHSTFLTE